MQQKINWLLRCVGVAGGEVRFACMHACARVME